MEFTDGIEQWKKEVYSLTEDYTESHKKIKMAFRLLNNEKDKKLIDVGRQYKNSIEKVMEKTESLMNTYLNEYKIEQKIPKNKPFFIIYNPKLDLESNIFNMESQAQNDHQEAVRRYSDISNRMRKEMTGNRRTTNMTKVEVNYQDDFLENDVSLAKALEINNPEPKDVNLLTEISVVEMPELNESKMDKIPHVNKMDTVKSFATYNMFTTPKNTNFMKSFDQKKDDFMMSHKQLPDFRRARSPMSNRNILMSPIANKRKQGTVQGLMYTGNHGSGKSKDKLSNNGSVRQQLAKNKSFSNLKEKPKNKRNSNITEAIKSKTLKKMLEGRHKEIIQDLKRGGLTHFDLTFADLKDVHVVVLADLIRENRGMRYIKLKGNKIGDEGIKALCKALMNSYINTIDVSYNNITYQGVTYLSDLAEHNKQLKTINIKKNCINKKLINRAVGEFTQNGVHIEI